MQIKWEISASLRLLQTFNLLLQNIENTAVHFPGYMLFFNFFKITAQRKYHQQVGWLVFTIGDNYTVQMIFELLFKIESKGFDSSRPNFQHTNTQEKKFNEWAQQKSWILF